MNVRIRRTHPENSVIWKREVDAEIAKRRAELRIGLEQGSRRL